MSKSPDHNPASARQKYTELVEIAIPSAPKNKKLGEEESERFKSLWPLGEYEALERLNKFLEKKINKYKDARNLLAANITGVISIHLSTGTLSARTAVRSARDINTSNNLDASNEGIKTWISEVAWRDFYKHVLAHWPYVCMSKPFKYEYKEVLQEVRDGMDAGNDTRSETVRAETVTEAPSEEQTSTITQEVETRETLHPDIERWYDEIIAEENPSEEDSHRSALRERDHNLQIRRLENRASPYESLCGRYSN